MGIGIAEQTVAFLWSVAFGALLGLFYDVFRIFRVTVRTPSVIVFFQDVVFWFFAGLSTFLFIFVINAGELRLFLFLGILAGAVVYFFTLGVLVMGLARAIVTFIKRVLRLVFKVLTFPFAALWRILGPFLGKSLKKVKIFFIYLFKSLLKKVRIVSPWRSKSRQEGRWGTP